MASTTVSLTDLVESLSADQRRKIGTPADAFPPCAFLRAQACLRGDGTVQSHAEIRSTVSSWMFGYPTPRRKRDLNSRSKPGIIGTMNSLSGSCTACSFVPNADTATRAHLNLEKVILIWRLLKMLECNEDLRS